MRTRVPDSALPPRAEVALGRHLGAALPPSACPPRARERLAVLGLRPAANPRHRGRDAAAALELLEAVRAPGRQVSLAGAPEAQPGLSARYAWRCTLGGPPAKRPGWGPDPAPAVRAAMLEEPGG